LAPAIIQQLHQHRNGAQEFRQASTFHDGPGSSAIGFERDR
jgi:hypothetical protein